MMVAAFFALGALVWAFAIYGLAAFVRDLAGPFRFEFLAVIALILVVSVVVYALVDRALGPDPDLERPWDPRR